MISPEVGHGSDREPQDAGRILVVGEALVDLVISPDGTVTAALGGAPFNTARTCGRLGADVGFVGAVSHDRFGTLIRRRLVDDGVDTSGLIDVAVPTTLAAAELDADGAAAYRFYIDGTSAPSVGRVPLPPSGTSVVFTGGLGLVLEPLADAVAAMVAAVGALPSADRPMVVVDVNCRPLVVADRERYVQRVRDVLTHTDAVKVSDDDLAYLYPGIATIAAARRLLGDGHETGPAVVLVTAGDGGVTIVTDDAERTVAVEPVEVVDTIGAGDAFIGGLCAWWTLTGRGRKDLRVSPTVAQAGIDVGAVEQAVRAGNAVAAVVCTRRGADPPSPANLDSDWLL